MTENNKYIIISEFVYEMDDEPAIHYLIRWNPHNEDSAWSAYCFDCSSVMSFCDYITKHDDIESPFVFDSKKEAKEVIKILRAYDDPKELKSENIKEVNYYLMFADIKIKSVIINKMIDLEEV